MGTSGNLVWNTFLGGAGNDNVSAIAVNSSDQIFVAGSSTAAWGAPTRAYSGGSDIFAAEVNLFGEVAWNTFLGGAGDDYGFGIALHGSSLLVMGVSSATWGSPSSAYSANDDTAVAQLTAGGLVWNTFLGGSGYDEGSAIAAAPNGIFAVVGSSNAAFGSGPLSFNGGMDAFVSSMVLPQQRFLPLVRQH